MGKKHKKLYCKLKSIDVGNYSSTYECEMCKKKYHIEDDSDAALDFNMKKQKCKGIDTQGSVTKVIADSALLKAEWAVTKASEKPNPITAIIEAARVQAGMTHIDDWLDTPSMFSNPGECYAKFVLEYKRMPAWKIMAFRDHMKQFKLFCTYKDGKRYRVNGASRMGDVWLQSDFTIENGYDLRVDLKDCRDWGPTP